MTHSHIGASSNLPSHLDLKPAYTGRSLCSLVAPACSSPPGVLARALLLCKGHGIAAFEGGGKGQPIPRALVWVLKPGPGKELGQSADLVFSPRELLTGGWRCLMRGPVREEKEAYSVPVLPGLCFFPSLLSQTVLHTKCSCLGLCVPWITLLSPEEAWIHTAGSWGGPSLKQLNRRVKPTQLPCPRTNTALTDPTLPSFMGPSSGRLG